MRTSARRSADSISSRANEFGRASARRTPRCGRGPFFFAANIATLASRSSRSGVSSSPVDSATPMLAVRNTSPVASMNGSVSAARTRSATIMHVALVLHFVAQHGELVAAEARDRVAGAQHALDALGDDGEQLVAGLQAEAVVHDLEVVEVHERPARPRAASRASCARDQRVGEVFEQHHPVGQLGERVVTDAVREQRLDALVLGHVVHDAEQARTVAPVSGSCATSTFSAAAALLAR